MAHYWTQTIMGCIGAVCFSVLFNVRGKCLGLIALSSALSWLGYVLCDMSGAGLFWSIFCGTVVAGLISEILARVVKAPVLMLLVPILIPLIPGGTLYNMMSCLVRSDHDLFLRYARQLLEEAGAIALGIIVCASVMSIFIGFQNHIRRKFTLPGTGKTI
jgi:uncharacterized membrane protein YjjB (DUF3815 family)